MQTLKENHAVPLFPETLVLLEYPFERFECVTQGSLNLRNGRLKTEPSASGISTESRNIMKYPESRTSWKNMRNAFFSEGIWRIWGSPSAKDFFPELQCGGDSDGGDKQSTQQLQHNGSCNDLEEAIIMQI